MGKTQVNIVIMCHYFKGKRQKKEKKKEKSKLISDPIATTYKIQKNSKENRNLTDVIT